jgi:Fe-S oxidoreductase
MDAPKLNDISFTDFYRAMVEREHLQVSREEATWTEGDAAPQRSVEVLLNFGCNVRQTPHLQREAVAVLEVLGVDFAAIAGQRTCCGKSYSGFGFPDMANHVLQKSIKRMAAHQPKRTIQWCSACEMQFSDAIDSQTSLEFSSEPLAGFLIERIDALGDQVPWRREVPVKVLVHGHLGEHKVRDRHPVLATELIGRIPGVEFVDHADAEVLDMCDNHGLLIAEMGSAEYRAAQAKLEQYLAAAGADTLLTLYHGCTRELSKFQSGRLRVRHYISVLAEALGVGKPDRFSEYWQLGDPVQVMEASRANWSSWGISEEEALRLAHKYFTPGYAREVPDCPCNGECTATGSAWLSPEDKRAEAAAS